MVKSQTIGITPTTHADSHRTGGTDPLTGAVGINDIVPVRTNVKVFDATLVLNTWTELDLSGQVGAQARNVVLMIQPTGSGIGIAFRTKSATDTFSDTTFAGSCCFGQIDDGKYGQFNTKTDTAGKIEYYSNTAQASIIYLIGWF